MTATSTTATSPLPIRDRLAPTDQAVVAEAIRKAHAEQSAIFPIGGGTSLDFGLAPTREGCGLELSSLAKVVDYTPRDMTVVVESGVRVLDLAKLLAEENQQLPIDAPRAAEATVGGLVATDWSGPRRYGYGTLRDYVIGISAVDGRGIAFKAGGRVVKNVAGYDFCKLLTGSMGTLGVITQLTFKVKPIPEQVVTLTANCADLDVADRALENLVHSPAPPTAIDLLVGDAWSDVDVVSDSDVGVIVVRFEGSESEVASMQNELAAMLAASGGTNVQTLSSSAADAVFESQVEFSDRGVTEVNQPSPLVIKIAALPSAAPTLMGKILAIDPDCTIESSAASGIIYARFANFDAADLTTVLIGKLRPAAVKHGGSLTVLSSEFEGLTAQVLWGGRFESSVLMERIKKKFDPANILNPGRFVF